MATKDDVQISHVDINESVDKFVRTMQEGFNALKFDFLKILAWGISVLLVGIFIIVGMTVKLIWFF